MLFGLPWITFEQGSRSNAGCLVDKGNQAIIGANVTVKSNTTGAATDLNGNYSIENPRPGNITLDVSNLGTQSVSVTVSFSRVAPANFTLTKDAQLLQEAVIFGYGPPPQT